MTNNRIKITFSGTRVTQNTGAGGGATFPASTPGQYFTRMTADGPVVAQNLPTELPGIHFSRCWSS